MAGLLCCTQTPGEIALAANTPKTVLQLSAPTNQRLRVRRWGVFFDGVLGTAEPVEVRLLRQTTAGTMTTTGAAPVKLSAGSEAVQATAQHTATVEPTAGDVLDVVEVHPQSGFDCLLPPDLAIDVPGAGRLGIECTAPAGVNVRAKFWHEE